MGAAWQLSLERAPQARRAPIFASILLVSPSAVGKLASLGAAVERAFPSDPVWYLAVVGVVPEAQGQGLGQRLLESGPRVADADGLPYYLETADVENVGFYERLGFDVDRSEVDLVGSGPTYWTMRRPPST